MNKTLWFGSRSFFHLVKQRRFFNRKRNRIIFLIVGLIIISIWQYSFFAKSYKLDKSIILTSSVGRTQEVSFVYFYYYLGLYPVALENDDYHVYSEEGARKIFVERSDELVMEKDFTIRFGDLGKMLWYLPSAYFNGAPINLMMFHSNVILFVAGLMAAFIAFWYIRQPLLGTLIVLLVGSNPFQLYEIYFRDKIFGVPISTALIVLAFHLPLLTNRRRSKYYLFLLPILTGIFLGTIRQIRSEPALIIVSAAFSYMVISRTRWRIKGLLVFLLALSFFITNNGWKSYFNRKIEEAFQAVKVVGGNPYTGPRDLHHGIWHPIWCGLGDFDEKYGYEWRDGAGVEYAHPILKEKYNIDLPALDSSKWGANVRGTAIDRTRVFFKEYWDKDKKYYKTVYGIPEYTEIIRDKIIHDITHDPLWYAGIILRRIGRVILETTPVRLSLGRWWITLFPLSGILLFPVLALLIASRNWTLLKIVCFSFPLSFVSILIYSGHGTTNYSCYHLFVVAICIAWLVEGVIWWYKNKKMAV